MKTSIKILVIILLITIPIGRCQSKVLNGSSKKTIRISNGLTLSNSFRAFLNDVADEVEDINDLKKYHPSNKVLSKYPLRFTNNQYWVSGFMDVKQGFNPDILKGLDISLTAYGNGLYSFSVPLKSIPQLLSTESVKRLEMSSKVKSFKRK